MISLSLMMIQVQALPQLHHHQCPNLLCISPPAIYLSKSVKLWQNDKSKGKETIVAVSGVELAADFWKDLLCNTTDCEGGDKYLSSYLIDTSGYVLASNRDDKEIVQAG